MDNTVSTVIVNYPYIRANTWHNEFSDTLYFAKNFLFLASITSFTVDTLNSLMHCSTVSFNLMSNMHFMIKNAGECVPRRNGDAAPPLAFPDPLHPWYYTRLESAAVTDWPSQGLLQNTP